MSAAAAAVAVHTNKERWVSRGLATLAALTVFCILGQFAVMLWVENDYQPEEGPVAAHSSYLASGRGLYFDVHGYPYTYSTYTPGFYLLAAGLNRLGVPILQAGRLVSFVALIGIVLLSRRLLDLFVRDRWSARAGTLLVAATANLAWWATACRVDVLGLFFALAAFYCYARWARDRRPAQLVASGTLLILAVFTKQTMIAAPVSIVLLLAREDRRRAAQFAAAVGAVAVVLALALNYATAGAFFDNVIWANANPLSGELLHRQLRYLLLAGAGLLAMAMAGLRAGVRERHPLYVYLAAATVMFLTTCPKVGTDLNFLLEPMLVLALCSAWTLDRLDFFPRYFRASPSPVTLLHLPLLFHVALNLAIAAKTTVLRVLDEPVREREYTLLRPFLQNAGGRILSVRLWPLVKAGRAIELEPFVYTLMVEANRADGERVRGDLADRKFSLVILYEDLFAPYDPRNALLRTLPEPHRQEIRKNYRLVGRFPGPAFSGNYLYQPIGTVRREL